jgi:hypothetical protein
MFRMRCRLAALQDDRFLPKDGGRIRPAGCHALSVVVFLNGLRELLNLVAVHGD